MKYLAVFFLIMFFTLKVVADPFHVEEKIIKLSDNWQFHMNKLSDYDGLKTFCKNDRQKQLIYDLLEEIHYYHDLLYEDLVSNPYDHSGRIMKRILKHIDKLEKDYNQDTFEQFFQEQCQLQSKQDRRAQQYSSGFGVHSYEGKIHVQEIEMYRYLKKLTRRINRIRKHVKDFQVRRLVWEY